MRREQSMGRVALMIVFIAALHFASPCNLFSFLVLMPGTPAETGNKPRLLILKQNRILGDMLMLGLVLEVLLGFRKW